MAGLFPASLIHITFAWFDGLLWKLMKGSSPVAILVVCLGFCSSKVVSICLAHLILSILYAPVMKWGTHYSNLYSKFYSNLFQTKFFADNLKNCTM